MIALCRAARPVGILLAILLTPVGCNVLRPVPEKKSAAVLVRPSDLDSSRG